MNCGGSNPDDGVTTPQLLVGQRTAGRLLRHRLCSTYAVTTMNSRELSPRQREILTLVAAGRTSKEIAGDLGISESTVNWHISNVFGRLGASSRAEAVALAMRHEAGESDGSGSRTADHQREARARSVGRPTVTLSSIAMAFALTLLVGVVSGALIAGWNSAPSPTPTAPGAPSVPAAPDGISRPTNAPGTADRVDHALRPRARGTL